MNIEAIIDLRSHCLDEKNKKIKKYLVKNKKLPSFFSDKRPLIFHFIDSISYAENTLRKEDQEYMNLILHNGGWTQINMVYEGISPLLQLYLRRLEPFATAFEEAGAEIYFSEVPKVYIRIVKALYRALKIKHLSTCKILLSLIPKGYIEKNQDCIMSKFADELYYGDADTNEEILILLKKHGVNIYEILLYREEFISYWGKKFGYGFTAFTLLFLDGKQEGCLEHFTKDWEELINLYNNDGNHILHVMVEEFYVMEDATEEEKKEYLQNIMRVSKLAGDLEPIKNALGENPLELAERLGYKDVCLCFR